MLRRIRLGVVGIPYIHTDLFFMCIKADILDVEAF